jgi:Family of unknown function (DUF5302)
MTAAESDSDATSTDAPAGAAPEDVKEQFRAALDRKRQRDSDAHTDDTHDRGKIHGTHGPAGAKRNFRRKSG